MKDSTTSQEDEESEDEGLEEVCIAQDTWKASCFSSLALLPELEG